MSSALVNPPPSSHTRMSYLDAIVQAQIEEMERDERVIMMGEDIAIYGSGDLIERFGEKRIWPMPISENHSGVPGNAAANCGNHVASVTPPGLAGGLDPGFCGLVAAM